MNLVEKLMLMKDKIEDSKRAAAQIEGKLETLYKQLLEEFDCKTIAQSEKELKQISTELEEKEQQLREGIVKLEESYEW